MSSLPTRGYGDTWTESAWIFRQSSSRWDNRAALLLEEYGGADHIHHYPFSFLFGGFALSSPGLMKSGHRARGWVLWAGETESLETEMAWKGPRGRLEPCRVVGGGRRGGPQTLPRGSERIWLMFKEDASKRGFPQFFLFHPSRSAINKEDDYEFGMTLPVSHCFLFSVLTSHLLNILF